MWGEARSRPFQTEFFLSESWNAGRLRLFRPQRNEGGTEAAHPVALLRVAPQVSMHSPKIKTHRRAQSAGAQSPLGKKPAEERIFRPTLRHLADRVATRLRAKARPGRTVTVRVRFADLHSVTRSVTLDTPISATAILAKVAEELVCTALADHPDEKTISLLAISVSHLEKYSDLQLELPLGLEDEKRRPGALDGRPCCGHDPRSFRMGGGRIRVGRVGTLPFRSRRVSRACRKGPLVITARLPTLR